MRCAARGGGCDGRKQDHDYDVLRNELRHMPELLHREEDATDRRIERGGEPAGKSERVEQRRRGRSPHAQGVADGPGEGRAHLDRGPLGAHGPARAEVQGRDHEPPDGVSEPHGLGPRHGDQRLDRAAAPHLGAHGLAHLRHDEAYRRRPEKGRRNVHHVLGDAAVGHTVHPPGEGEAVAVLVAAVDAQRAPGVLDAIMEA
mmetsp:Transcript_92209/g.282249  ORF Transcript_92209/g.282249 Transcript_92209/m.282249 type:complete len:201 (-) Transcript_92209:402-1004(-)